MEHAAGGDAIAGEAGGELVVGGVGAVINGPKVEVGITRGLGSCDVGLHQDVLVETGVGELGCLVGGGGAGDLANAEPEAALVESGQDGGELDDATLLVGSRGLPGPVFTAGLMLPRGRVSDRVATDTVLARGPDIPSAPY